MIPPNAMNLVKDLHATYVARSGYEIALNMGRENVWREWCQFGEWQWTAVDLTRVIGYLRAQIRNDKRNDGALKFSNLIGQPDKFEEDLALAKAAFKQVHAGKPFRPNAAPQGGAAEKVEEDGPMDAAEAARLWKEQFKKTP